MYNTGARRQSGRDRGHRPYAGDTHWTHTPRTARACARRDPQSPADTCRPRPPGLPREDTAHASNDVRPSIGPVTQEHATPIWGKPRAEKQNRGQAPREPRAATPPLTPMSDTIRRDQDDSSCNYAMKAVSVVKALLYDEAPVRLKPLRNSSVTAWNWRLIGLGLKSG